MSIRRRVLTLVPVAIVLVAVVFTGRPAQAQDNPLEPLDTSSPQATYLSFIEQVEVLEDLLLAYERDRSEANQSAFTSALDEVESLFDFSEVADANRTEIVSVSFARLADVVNRIPPPPVDEIPDADDVAAADEDIEITIPGIEVPFTAPRQGIDDYTLPGSEITISRLETGPRDGEYVFSARTVADLAEWREQVDHLPVNEGVRVDDWVRVDAEFTGHLVPTSLVDALPDALDRDVLGSPLWKLLVDITGLVAVVVIASLCYRWVGRRGRPNSVARHLYRLTTPIVVLVAVAVVRRLMAEQVNHSGDLATGVNLIVTFVIWAAWTWAFCILVSLVVEWVIATPRISDEGIDAHLLRLLGTVVTVGGAIVFASVGLSRLGVPTLGLGIGAGVAGLTLALAATSTLENLLGGITLYLDKPFRVDDKIGVGDDIGFVEAIGPRSTRIRKLDDTKVTLPNADISRTKVVNYSERRHILFLHVVGVRYETSVDQLRSIVDTIDARLRTHPMVHDETDSPRVRVIAFGSSSIDIEVRADVDTDEFPVFTAVQQELLLLIHEIIEAAGSSFAFPSSTTYLADDTGLPAPTVTPRPDESSSGVPRTGADLS